MQRDDCAFGDEARKEEAGLLEIGERGCGGRDTKDSFGEAGRGYWKLLGAGGVEDQAGSSDPVAQKVEREEGLSVVTPVREAGGGQLAGGGDYGGVQSNAFLPGALQGATANPHEPGPVD
jgi:hypothetical protein